MVRPGWTRRSDMHFWVLIVRPRPNFMRKVDTIGSWNDWGNYYCSFACLAFSWSARRPKVTQKETVGSQRGSAHFNNSNLHELNKGKSLGWCWLTLNISREKMERLSRATRLHGSPVIANHSPKPWWTSIESYWSCNSRDFGIDKSVRMSNWKPWDRSSRSTSQNKQPILTSAYVNSQELWMKVQLTCHHCGT